MLVIIDFTMHNKAEHKRMGQYLSFGQLYDVHNTIKIYTGYRAVVGPIHLL
jgi:hypothetical protein